MTLLAVVPLACDRLRRNGAAMCVALHVFPPPTIPSSQPLGWAARASCDVLVCLVLIGTKDIAWCANPLLAERGHVEWE